MTAADLLSFTFGVLICAFGAVALVVHWLRAARKDRLLLWIGAFACVYGLRVFFEQPLGDALGIPPIMARSVASGLNDVIILPALLFAREIYGPGWKRSLQWVIAISWVYLACAVVANVAARDPNYMPDPALTILAPGAIFVFLSGGLAGYHPPPFPEWRILVGGVVAFIAFVVNEHAVNDGVVPWTFRAEPLGALLSFGCLGYIALARSLAQGRQLASIEQEMESARRIQQSILPHEIPSVPRVTIVARYLPLAAVAGDFYDVSRLGDQTLAVLIADVSGHGVPAALIASMVKVSFSAEVARTHDPGRVLEGMNVTLCGLLERSYVTAACAVVDVSAHVLRYAVAGHPPPFVVSRRDGAVTALDQRGMFLGIFPFATYSTGAAPLDGGIRVILYTDGVTEAAAPDSDDLFGADRFAAFAADERARGPRDFVDTLLSALRSFTQRHPLPHDDVTVVVIDVD